MAEVLALPEGSKAERYAALLPQLASLLAGERDLIACMANAASVLATTFGWHWVGFYRVAGDELILGPFAGPLACTRIAFGRGVCGSAWAQNATQRVSDVDAFPGHIACSSLSRSEIVVPVRNAAGEVIAVLDVDASELAAFDEIDQQYLEQLAGLFSNKE
ncbi:GAF domain-containing protein [Chitinilyticum piscinae]|uniref:GAF domain-containing protein n=1 Tax=Chitinilyticum piscinae TaxID=2866724 RepID=A0A8J7G0S9_9NEIS|nr:GAF domain-containing protein [Chitinilyticum piscinae]MBE9609875.1 GAF domain-containing protein [Chitinilyticum piscinae]